MINVTLCIIIDIKEKIMHCVCLSILYHNNDEQVDKMPRCQDLAIFVVVTDRQTDFFTPSRQQTDWLVYPCACTWGIYHLCIPPNITKSLKMTNYIPCFYSKSSERLWRVLLTCYIWLYTQINGIQSNNIRLSPLRKFLYVLFWS